MGLPNEVNSALIGAANQGGYQIDQSLRLRGSQFISAPDNGTLPTANARTATFSQWVKRGRMASDPNGTGTAMQIAYQCTGGGSLYQTFVAFSSDDRLNIFSETDSGGAIGHFYSSAQFRDNTAWYHIVHHWDTTQSTSTNRMKCWVNGVQVTVWDQTAYPSQNATLPLSSTGRRFTYGTRSGNEDQIFSGHIAECYYIDGQALDADSFGEFNADGVWIPKAYGGSFPGRSWYLNFKNSSGILNDQSGNGINFSTYNASYAPDLTNTTSVNYDWSNDSPTKNIPVGSYANNTNSGFGLDYAAMKIDTNSGTSVFPVNKAFREGKMYCEWYHEASSVVSPKFGFQDMEGRRLNTPENNLYSLMHYGNGTNYAWQFNSFTDYGSISGWNNNNEWIAMATDLDNGTHSLYRNGSLLKTLDFTSQIPDNRDQLASAVYYAAGSGASVFYLNAGQQDWHYTPPAGYDLPMTNDNAPEVAIKNPGEYFNAFQYTGDGGSNRAITGVGFQPDLVWIKDQATGTDHLLFDSSRGATKIFKTVGTGAEETDANSLKSFDSDGFTVGNSTSNGVNISGRTYSCWCWKKSATSGFDIQTYTSNSTKPRNISHSLGKKPEFLMFFNRDSASSHQTMWTPIDNSGTGATKAYSINSTGNGSTSSDYFNNTEPTSSQFTVFDSTSTHAYGGSDRFVTYLWTTITGFSKVGKYVGTGSVNGTYVYCDFKPAFIFIKCVSDSGTNWVIYDDRNDQQQVNPKNRKLYPNTSGGINPSDYVDFLANGFKWRGSSGDVNGGATYCFMAFARSPFQGSNVAPGTAFF